MYRNNDFIYEAVSQLEQLINIPIDIDSSRKKYDAIINIHDYQFIVDTRSSLRTTNQGLVFSKLEELKENSSHPIILIAKYISKDATIELKKRKINYIDIAGNAYIKNNDLAIFVERQKRITEERTNQSRAFQEAGIKIIFYLLLNLENLQHSYRAMAKNANVSLGSVSNVMAELEDLNFLIKNNNKRVLKNKSELLERWMIAYNTVLRPRILRKKMKFINPNSTSKWNNINFDKFNGSVLWGGEPGGAILTNYLKPEKFTIFTDLDLPTIAKSLKLVPDQNGDIVIFQKFWNCKSDITNVAPPLLIYTDLINSGLSRNNETAKIILENEYPNYDF